jgi:polysaccharide biosynthesis protein PslG
MRCVRLVTGFVALATAVGVVSMTASESESSTPAAAAAARPLPRIGEKVGVADGNILWRTDAEMIAELDGIVAMGGRWLRVDVPWSVVQHQGPESWNWIATDRVIRAARARGIKVLGLLGHAPVWNRPSGAIPFSAPLDLDLFARFAGEAAKRYAPLGVHHWEVWNEPNIKMFWGSAPDVQVYAEMLKKTAVALRAADPEVFIVSAGLAPATYVENESIPPLYFLAGIYVYGARDSFDAVGIHPYSFPKRPTTAETWNTFWQQRYALIVMSWFDDDHKKIWATEFGAPTGTSATSVSEAEQAAHVTEGIRAWREYPFDGPIFLYTWKDLSTNEKRYSDNLGLRRVDGSAKPVYTALRSQLQLRSP